MKRSSLPRIKVVPIEDGRTRYSLLRAIKVLRNLHPKEFDMRSFRLNGKYYPSERLVDKEKFDAHLEYEKMSRRDKAKVAPPCGSVGCLIGWLPLKDPNYFKPRWCKGMLSGVLNWPEMSATSFPALHKNDGRGIGFLTSTSWTRNDNTINGAINRARFLLDYGIPMGEGEKITKAFKQGWTLKDFECTTS